MHLRRMYILLLRGCRKEELEKDGQRYNSSYEINKYYGCDAQPSKTVRRVGRVLRAGITWRNGFPSLFIVCI